MSQPNSHPHSLNHSPSIQLVDDDKVDSIRIPRSDGRHQDLGTVFTLPTISEVIVDSTSSKTNKTPEPDTGNISLPRSDGLTHDIINVFRGKSDSQGKTMKIEAKPRLSIGRIDLSFLAGGNSSESNKVNKESRPSFTAGNLSGTVSPTPPITANANPSTYYMKSVRIVHFSDTHNFLTNAKRSKFLPDGNILVHSGNFTNKGTEEEFRQFDDWLSSVSDVYHYRVVCVGSRDVKVFGNNWEAMVKLLPHATHVLCHEEAVILGIRFYAVPWTWTYKKNFMLRPGAPSATNCRFNDVPENIDVLITHSPAFERLDTTITAEGNLEHWGSHELVECLRRVRPKLHLHGHVKDNRGFLPAFNNFPLTINSCMCDVEVSVMYACPFVVRADQLLLDPIKNTVTWNFRLDSLDG